MTTSTENSDSVAAGDDRRRRASIGTCLPRGTRDHGSAPRATMVRVFVDAMQDRSATRYLPVPRHDRTPAQEVAKP